LGGVVISLAQRIAPLGHAPKPDFGFGLHQVGFATDCCLQQPRGVFSPSRFTLSLRGKFFPLRESPSLWHFPYLGRKNFPDGGCYPLPTSLKGKEKNLLSPEGVRTFLPNKGIFAFV